MDKKKFEIDHEDLDYVEDTKAALIERTTPVARFVLVVIIIALVAIIMWAYYAMIDETTFAEAKVIPSSNIQEIQSLEGGLVEKILVKPGDIVKKGQPLLIIDNTKFMSEYDEAMARQASLIGKISRLEAQANGKSKIDFPNNFAKEHPEIVKRETALFNTNLEAQETALKVLHDKHKLVSQELRMVKSLESTGVIPKIDVLRIARQVRDAEGQIKAKIADFQEKSLEDLNEEKAELNALEETLPSKKDKVVRTVVKSPMDGIVKKIAIHTVGGVIKPGMRIMQIVPQEDQLLILARVRPQDIGFIHAGQQARVKISAYDSTIYGDLDGKVIHVSADAIQDEDKPENTYYEAFIKTDKNYLERAGKKYVIIPGMIATVNILTGKKSVMDYILKPILKTKERAFQER